MTIARAHLVDPTVSRWYHCVTRCVRRAFLCGTDELTGKCFEHRKVVLQNRLEFLAGEFQLDRGTNSFRRNPPFRTTAVGATSGANSGRA